MTIFKDILENEVVPALGCTEPIACAYAAAAAAEQLLPNPVKKMTLNVDSGTYKNGAAVTVPHSEGGKGNLIAAAMGAFTAHSSTKLEVLRKVTSHILQKAITLVESENVEYSCMEDRRVFYVEARVESDDSWARCVLSGGHTNIIVLEKDGQEIDDGKSSGESDRQDYRSILKEMSLKDILGEVVQLDQETREYLQRGVEMNLAIAGYGLSVDDGIIGTTPENSIRNLSRIALEGMFQVDPTVIHILQDKATSHGRA